MIAFSSAEIFLSCVYAVVFGVLCSIFITALRSLNSISKILRADFCGIIRFDKIFHMPKFVKVCNKRNGAFMTVLSVVIIGVGFSILSYVALDGEIRIYMLILTYASLYLSNYAFSDFLTNILEAIYHLLLIVLLLPIRCLVACIKQIKTKIKSFNKVKVKNK